MVAERIERDRLIVLRGNAQNDAALLQRQRHPLQRRMGFAQRAAAAERKTLDTVIADDAAPHRVVEIQNQHAARSSHLRRDEFA